MIAPIGHLRPGSEPVPAFQRRGASAGDTAANAPVETGPAVDLGSGRDEIRRVWLRVLFALDIVGAGGPGVLMLAAPDKAGELLFAGNLSPDAATRVLGCVWIALGLMSVAGLMRPVRFSPVLLVQFAYKLVWLLAIGLPTILAGGSVPPVLTVIFAAWVLAVGIAAPWRTLLAPETAPAGSMPRKPR